MCIVVFNCDGSQKNSPDKQKYIVVFNDHKNDKKINDDIANESSEPLPGKSIYKYKIINAQVMELTGGQLDKVKARKDVKYIVPDSQAYADLKDVVPAINATAAWSLGYTGLGVNVSIIDSGIDATHPDLAGKVILWTDFLNNMSQPYDDWGHGTHVAGIIAGSGSASGGLYKGVANGANLFGAKILNTSGVAYISDMIAAIDWSVENHADVISLSLSTPNYNQALDEAVHNAVANGVIVVCSAGNTGPMPGTIKYPAGSADVIAVGSVNKYNSVSSFSSRGPTWDNRTKPDIVAYGEYIISARATGTSLGSPIGQYYTTLSGTSMSCPQVSAACAILLEANRSLKPTDVKNVLLSSAKRISTTYPNNISGWGILDVGGALNKVVTNSDTDTDTNC
jgi:serine protease AprX